MNRSSRSTSKPSGLSLERRRGQSITLPEINLVIHVMKVYAGKVQLVFENTSEEKTPVHRTELLKKEFSGPSSL